MGSQQWAVDNGQSTMGSHQWVDANGHCQWVVDSGWLLMASCAQLDNKAPWTAGQQGALDMLMLEDVDASGPRWLHLTKRNV